MSSAGARMMQAFKSIFGGGKGKVSTPLKSSVLTSTPPPFEPSSTVEAFEVKPPAQVVSASTASTEEKQTAEPNEQTKPKAKEQTEAATLKAVKPHIPMIRFRKGGLPEARPAASQPAPQVAHVVSKPPKSAQGSSSTPDWTPVQVGPLEFWQLPSKFRKRDLDELEIEAINMGGRDKPYQ
ncbi:uncharacterized protein LOC131878751 [Tigriopus californicus]|uniref:uncharacterized protein LOC131878751 n=1 Tax=Tigriopus californicus TaxID=6832 RepID=UPI0027DA2F4E|nr:uncharacterized protein LOC131878751 [Tigriopus californicus]